MTAVVVVTVVPKMSAACPSGLRSQARLPLAVVMAIRLPNIPRLLRPIVSLWWLIHFAAGACVGLGVFLATQRGLQAYPIMRVLVPLILDLGVLFAANLYLLLALALLFGTPHLWLKLWRMRLALDLVLLCAMRLLFKP
jgi:hypothetical protein